MEIEFTLQAISDKYDHDMREWGLNMNSENVLFSTRMQHLYETV